MPTMDKNINYEVCVVGGAGHVGLPLGVTFANAGIKTVLLDISEEALHKIRDGKFPFMERGGDEALQSALRKKTLFFSSSPEVIGESKFVIIVIGTPVDEYLNPRLGDILGFVEKNLEHFRDGQILILRSTLYPGTTEQVHRFLKEKNRKIGVAFCPERVSEGEAIEETKTLTQIVSAFDEKTLAEVTALFKKVTTADVITASPIEAELAKLFSNFWRYARFAVANQFFMIANDNGLDYHRIHKVMKHKYPRSADLPSPGFAAGPCLFKDTMQLNAFSNNKFALGNAAMLINEGLANHVMEKLQNEFRDSLSGKTIGILGMSFKAEVDDPRDSLSFKLKRLASHKCRRVLCADEYVKDENFVPLETLLNESDIIILATPHKKYREIRPEDHPGKKFVDVWGLWH